MSDVTINVATAAKKNRRGVSNKTQLAHLKFHESDAAKNGLFIGHLDSVTVDWSEGGDNSTFAGVKVPRLTFRFASNHASVSERRYVTQTLFPVESNVDTIPGGKNEWQVNNVFNWIKHVLDTFVLKGREMTEAEEEALTLPFEDFDDDNNYVPVEVEDVAKGYGFIFQNTADMLNGAFNLKEGEVAKPAYKTADGKFIIIWMKLLRHTKTRNGWRNVTQNGDLGFPLVGNGLIEIFKQDKAPAGLRIDFAKESITPKEVNKTPSVGTPGIPGIPGGAGVTVGAPIAASPMSSMPDVGGDMPF